MQDLGLVATVASEEEGEAHQWLFQEGDIGDKMFLVVSGSVSLSINRPEGPLVVATRGAKSFFGEMSLLDDDRRSASAQCSEHCRFLVLEKENFVQLVMDYPVISLAIFKYLCGLVRQKK